VQQSLKDVLPVDVANARRISPPGAVRRVALAGAGNIAAVHAEALTALAGTRVAGVIDPQVSRAETMARKYGAPTAESLSALVRAHEIDAVHILTPPNLHQDLILEAMALGVPTLVEKPMVSDEAGAAVIAAAAGREGAPDLYVNHNFIFNPTFQKMLKVIESGQLGQATAFTCTYAMPLRQLAAGQFGHWMFRRPANLLLEQAVHPLSQLLTLIGEVSSHQVLAGPPHQAPVSMPIPQTLSAQLKGSKADAQLFIHFGAAYPVWRITALCSDGVITADMLRNCVTTEEQTAHLEVLDNVIAARRLGADAQRQAIGGLRDYGMSMLGLKGRSDPFYQSMKGSLDAFHSGDATRIPHANTAAGARDIIQLCESLARDAFPEPARPPAPAARPRKPAFQAQAVVTGGTGFIGRCIVRSFAERGINVAVVARSTAVANDLFDSVHVRAVDGDVRSKADMLRVMQGAEYVIDAAMPQVGEDWDDCERTIRSTVTSMAEACEEARVRKLVHLSSIAALYLGDASETITGATPVDPQPLVRPNYSRAKALGEALLLQLHKERGLPVSVLRPGVVVGANGIALHTGVGLFSNDRHCVGWAPGTNEIPFVLSEDVAAACVAAALTEGSEGRVFNLVGDVRLTAQEYVRELSAALNRPLVFHGQPTEALYAAEMGKWLVKKAGGRKVPAPSLRDLRSRAMFAAFDCSDIKSALGWAPVADRQTFIDKAIGVHAPGR